ncbi:MAG: response regulator transcription factor, partial [Clostridia bacterium]|nr:response regulator transcription factor [Clostridia bacterium]
VRARIKSVLRRSSQREQQAETIEADGVRIDASARSVKRNGEEIHLTVKEFNLLWTMANQRGRVFSREDLHRALWNNDHAEGSAYDLRTVDVHIRRLREKLEIDPANPRYIMTKWGVGYYFVGR